MKSIFNRAPLILSGVLMAGTAAAQMPDSSYVKPFSPVSAYSTWSIGVGAGVLTPYSIFNSKEDFYNNGTKLGYNAYIKDQLLPSLGIQLGYTGGKVEGMNSRSGLYSDFTTKLNYAVDLTAQFTLANISWMHRQNFIQPYISAGFGMAGYTPSFTASAPGSQPYTVDHQISNGYIPVGFGFKFNISPAVNIDLGYTAMFVNGDNFDGYNYGGTNDKFSYFHGGLEFALGASKSKPQLATHNPVASMRTEYLMDEQRLQMQEDAERARNEQLRRDLDATRGDLSATKNALNQTNANLARFTTDSDNDGVPDFLDKCPGTPAGTKVDGAGCPLPVNKPDVKVYVTEQDRAVVKEAVRNLEFDFNKATIRPHSFPSLDRLAALLAEKGFNLKLAGYTDNVGSQAFNLKLSKDRAESVKSYLVSKNADGSKIIAEGYGKEHPIASNKTAKGRQINRRVEFTLY